MDSQLGLQRGTIRLVDSDPTWPAAFESADRLRSCTEVAGLPPLAFEHIGSTAVRGLIAKPILDLMAGCETGTEPGPYIALLASAGYEPRGPRGVPKRKLLVLGSDVARTHHLNLVEVDGLFWREHLLFRDSLRNDSALAAAYATLKEELMARYATDRAAYSAGKQAFVRRVVEGGVANADCIRPVP